MLTRESVQELKSEMALEESALPLIFNALSDSGRFHIFKVLLTNEGLCVTDIAKVLSISVPAASQQLKLLELSGLIARERHGQMICYRVKRDDVVVRSLVRLIGQPVTES